MTTAPPVPEVDVETLRCEIQNEYAEVAKAVPEGAKRDIDLWTG